jgi:hypothetical protein
VQADQEQRRDAWEEEIEAASTSPAEDAEEEEEEGARRAPDAVETASRSAEGGLRIARDDWRSSGRGSTTAWTASRSAWTASRSAWRGSPRAVKPRFLQDFGARKGRGIYDPAFIVSAAAHSSERLVTFSPPSSGWMKP